MSVMVCLVFLASNGSLEADVSSFPDLSAVAEPLVDWDI